MIVTPDDGATSKEESKTPTREGQSISVGGPKAFTDMSYIGLTCSRGGPVSFNLFQELIDN